MPYRNEVLKRSLLYAVRHVFLIDRDSGLLLLDVSSGSHVLKDADMTSGMLTVIQDLVRESFPEERLPLETVGVGQFTIYLQHGSSAILAAAVKIRVCRVGSHMITTTAGGARLTFKPSSLERLAPPRDGRFQMPAGPCPGGEATEKRFSTCRSRGN
jgi:hypothetical protein